MSQHPSARLTPRGRERMAERVEAGEPVAEVARQVGAGRQTASRWLGRRRRGEPTAGRPSSLQRPPRIQGHRAQVHQAVQPLAERQGRADEPHPRPGVAVRAGPGERGRYNWDRPHSACGGLPPMSRIVGVNNVLAHNS